LRLALRPLVAVRAAVEALTAFAFITALAHMRLGNITAILQATPIIITLLTVMLGIEQVGWRRWLAVVAGFVGVLIVVRPSASGFDVWSLLALLAAVLVAVRDLITRRIAAAIPSSVVALVTTAAVAVVGLVIGLIEGIGTNWRVPTDWELVYLALAAGLVSAGNYGIVVAFRRSDVSVVSPFRYSVIVWAIALGYLVWGDIPDLPAMTGTLLIVAGGLYTIHRERVRMREAARPLEQVPDAGATAKTR